MKSEILMEFLELDSENESNKGQGIDVRKLLCAAQSKGDHKQNSSFNEHCPITATETITPHSDGAPLLANRKAPWYHTKQERPAHRVMLEYAAKGYSVKEIAEITGYTPVCVNNVLRQPHAQQTLVNEIRRINGEDEEVVEIIKQNVVASCKLYEAVLNGGQLAESVEDRKLQMEAAERFMNRRYGKPNQPVNRGTDVDLNTMSIAEVAAQLPKTEGTA